VNELWKGTTRVGCTYTLQATGHRWLGWHYMNPIICSSSKNKHMLSTAPSIAQPCIVHFFQPVEFLAAQELRQPVHTKQYQPVRSACLYLYIRCSSGILSVMDMPGSVVAWKAKAMSPELPSAMESRSQPVRSTGVGRHF
jgi:hypothetical protein